MQADREPFYDMIFLPHDGREPWRSGRLTLERAIYFSERDAVEALLVLDTFHHQALNTRQRPWEPLLKKLGFHVGARIMGHICLRGVAVIGYIPPLLPPTSWAHLLQTDGLID